MRSLSSSGIFTVKGMMKILRLTFISGPFLLFTTRLSSKNASIMIMLCIPALLLAAVLTIPSMLFDSPEQNAYYEFAHAIDGDPTRLIILGLAGICAILALAVPATAPKPITAIRS